MNPNQALPPSVEQTKLLNLADKIQEHGIHHKISNDEFTLIIKSLRALATAQSGLPCTRVALVRQAILQVLDAREWRFDDIDMSVADADRVDFADAVIAWLPESPKP